MEAKPLKWTEKTIALEAKKFKSRTEFAQSSGSAYKAASERGILDDVCDHMKILHNGYLHCVYVIRYTCYVQFRLIVSVPLLLELENPALCVAEHTVGGNHDASVHVGSSRSRLRKCVLYE